MNWFPQLKYMFRRLDRDRAEREMDEEIRAHIDLQTTLNIEAGMPAGEARLAALRAFGSTTLAKEDSRAMWGFRSLEALAQDVRYGLRIAARKPGFTTVAILTLALGIGANTAIFSLVNGILLRPLSFPKPERLVSLTEDYAKGGFVLIAGESTTMEVAATLPGEEFNLAQPGQSPLRVTGTRATATFFPILGVGAELGRVFHAGEDSPGNDQVVILSHGLWQRQFGSDPEIIGRRITLDGEDREVVGVMPANFRYGSTVEALWLPLTLDPRNKGDFWGPVFPVIGRLKPGVSLEQARLELRRLVPEIIAASPFTEPPDWNSNSTVVSLQQTMVSNVRETLLLLLGAVGLVLVIACANVANLLLARAASRQREMALRVALGANRSRIVRQLLTESVLLALGGGLIGVVLAHSGLAALRNLLPANTPRLEEVAVDGRVLMFTAGLAILTGLLFGLAPALRSSKVGLVESLNAGGRGAGGDRKGRLHNGLVVAEMGLAVVLLTGAGLLIKSLWLLSGANPGFDPEQLVTVEITPDRTFSKDRSRCVAFYDELLKQARLLPGVKDVAAINSLPLSGDLAVLPAMVEDYPPEPVAPAPLFWAGAITPTYMKVMAIPILAGRALSDADRTETAGVVLVTTSTARRFWPGQDPIGKHVKGTWENEWRTVVGVVADVKQYGLAEGRPGFLDGEIYMPLSQAIFGRRQFVASMTLLLRTYTPQLHIGQEVRNVVASLNSGVPVGEVRTMKAVVSASISRPTSVAWLFGFFSALALLLGALGVYSLISYSVAERRHEVGVRMALGATSGEIVKLVIGEGMVLTAIGVVSGVAAGIGLTRFLGSLLYNVKPLDVTILASVAIVLSVVALIATYIPARRASRIDPMAALRFE
jgi:putative ABC transport system permease protein